MNLRLSLPNVLAVVTAINSIIACAGAPDDWANEGRSGVSSKDSTAGSCPASFVTVDLGTLTSCGGGKGHCIDPSSVQTPSGFNACPGSSQVCVPDEILQADGQPLKSCTSIIGAGGCITMSILNIPDSDKANLSMLKQDVCADGQVCAPCTDPTNNNAPTPFCQPTGVLAACSGAGSAPTSPATPPPDPNDGTDTTPAPDPASPPDSTTQGCCTTNGVSNGICISADAIPADQADQTVTDTCTGDNKCVPKAFVEGKPVKCSGMIGDGVCMDACFNSMLGAIGGIGVMSAQECGPTELCVPCSALGDKGVPGCT